MSEDLRPLAECTTEEIVKHLASRVDVGAYVVMVGCPSAEASLREKKLNIGSLKPTSDHLYLRGEKLDREKLEDLHRCVGYALGNRIAIFHQVFGVDPRYLGENP